MIQAPPPLCTIVIFATWDQLQERGPQWAREYLAACPRFGPLVSPRDSVAIGQLLTLDGALSHIEYDIYVNTQPFIK
jgi:hypothetical protein